MKEINQLKQVKFFTFLNVNNQKIKLYKLIKKEAQVITMKMEKVLLKP